MTGPLSGAFKGVSYKGAFGNDAQALAGALAGMGRGRAEEQERQRQAALAAALQKMKEQELGLATRRVNQGDAELAQGGQRIELDREKLGQQDSQFAQGHTLDRDRLGLDRDKLGQDVSEGALDRSSRERVASIGATSRENVAESNPRGMVVMPGVDGQLQVIDKGNGTARPVTRDGAPMVGVAGKAPVGLQSTFAENEASITSIDAALELAKARPESFGLSKILPDMINQRTDPEGVEARAALANIGSLQIKLRSGAAVTAKEFPRLSPFVPNVHDSAETVVTKLERLKAELTRINAEIAQSNPSDPRVNRGTEPAAPVATDPGAALKAKYGLE
jgi:hypothetical protein